MSRNEVRIYRSRRPVRTALLILAAAAAVVVILAFAVFFGFRRYIVYTSDGVRLEIPWLEEPSPGEDEPPLDYGSQQ